jgi:NitT/TauT family transport system substrate-binding protein
MQTSFGKSTHAVQIWAATGLLFLIGAVPPGSLPRAADLDFGKPGEPVKLVIGHPSHYTAVWSVHVLHGKELWKKYLPAGSTVEYQIGLQGSVIVNNMLAGKQHIGYLGDIPAIVSTTKQEVADLRIVATLGLGYDQCNVLLARNDAPQFKNVAEAIKWLDGKQVAIPKGSCADRFAEVIFQKGKVKPGAYLNQNIEVITSGFRAGKLDATVVWEPVASRLAKEGLARRILSGVNFKEMDGAFLVMRAELIKQRPDVVKGWLNAELDAQLYMSDPRNAADVMRMVKSYTTGVEDAYLWAALYGSYSDAQGGSKQRLIFPFVITPDATSLVEKATTFLYSIKGISVNKLRPEAVMPEFAQQVLAERKVGTPVGEVIALPDSAYRR